MALKASRQFYKNLTWESEGHNKRSNAKKTKIMAVGLVMDAQVNLV